MAGFFSKAYLISEVISAGDLFSALCMVFASIISAVYYIRLIKIMYFDKTYHTAFVYNPSPFLVYIAVSFAFANIFFLFWGDLLLLVVKYCLGL